MRTIRARLFFYLALAVLASSALTVGVAALLTHSQVQRQALTNLDRQVQAVSATAGELGAPAYSPDLRVFTVQRGVLRRAAPRAEQALVPAIRATGQADGTVTVGNRTMLYSVRTSPAGPIALVRPATLQADDWSPFVTSLILAGLGGAAVAAGLSFLLARRLARPLNDMARATRQLAQGAPDARVPVRGNDELGMLASSFNDMARQLSHAKQAEREFLMSVSHELKTPLAAIRGYSEALEDHAAEPAQAAPIIRSEADRLERLVSDLLDLARLDRHEFTVAYEEVDLDDVAQEVRNRYLPRANDLGIELKAHTQGPAPARGDHHRILQVVSNLVENALRYTPEGGSVQIETAPGRIAVKDTGPGIASEDLPHVFERFYLHNKYKLDRPVGSGLGLAIVSELVTMMGGTVCVDTRPGAGATFVISLPSSSLTTNGAAIATSSAKANPSAIEPRSDGQRLS